MILIFLLLLLTNTHQYQPQNFRILYPQTSNIINQYYVYGFQRQKVHYVTHICPQSFLQKLRNLQLQTTINILKNSIHQGTTFISVAQTLGLQQIIISQSLKEKGKSKIVKQDLLQYTMVRKNIYLNDFEEYTSIFNMQISNFSCLNTKDNVFYQSFNDWITPTLFSSTQYVFLLSFSQYFKIFDTIYSKIILNKIKIKILIVGNSLSSDFQKQKLFSTIKFLNDNNYQFLYVVSEWKEKNEQISIIYQKMTFQQTNSYFKDKKIHLIKPMI